MFLVRYFSFLVQIELFTKIYITQLSVSSADQAVDQEVRQKNDFQPQLYDTTFVSSFIPVFPLSDIAALM